MNKLKILHTVEFYNPSVGGAQEVVKQLSEHLVSMGHDVTVATTKLPNRNQSGFNGVNIIEFDVRGNDVRGYSGADIEKYKKFLINGDYDVVMNYAAQQWTADLAFKVLDQIKGRKIFVPCGYSGLYNPEYNNYFRLLPTILKKYDRCVYLSQNYRDINFAKQHKLTNSIVIPNGADEREFSEVPLFDKQDLLSKYGIPSHNRILLCVSNHTGQKGHREAIASFKLLKANDVSLVFIGDINLRGGCYTSCLRSSKINNIITRFMRQDKTIHLLNLSREETIKFYLTCDIFLFLSNIECSPLVLFESAAAGKPFVASSCGNALEISKWTKSGVIVSSTQDKNGVTKTNISDVVKVLDNLLLDTKQLIMLGKNGRKNWLAKYSWATIARVYERIYKR